MNHNGFEPRSTPGYSYGQPNPYLQAGFPGTGGTQNPAAGYPNASPAFQQAQQGGFGMQNSAPYGYASAQASGGYSPVPPMPPTNGYNTIPPTPATNGYNPVPPIPTGSGYGSYVPQPSPVTPTGSFIPQTPYSPGYTSPGYQPGYPKPAANGYPQGYSAYNQMGKIPQNTIPPKQTQENVPLNGGGYVPQPVSVRRRPMERNDKLLYIVGGALALLFILAIWPFSQSIVLKWLFLIPAVLSTALLWVKPITDDSKKLCYTIVAGALCIAMVISMITTNPGNGNGQSSGAQNDQKSSTSSGGSSGNNESSGQTDPYAGYGTSNYQQNVTSAPQPTSNANALAGNRLLQFFTYWGENKLDNMVELCAPSWQVKQENAKKSIFTLLQNRRPTEFTLENISGPQGGDSLTFIMRVSIDKNNGKPVTIYQMSVRMVNESGQWYVDPNSLVSNEIQETPDPNATPVVTPTPTPYVDGNTVLYYNPDGGKLYHSDPNCISLHAKYLPLKGKFTYSEINSGKYAELEPCNVCGAPLRNR